MVYCYELVNKVLLVQTRSQLGSKLKSAARMKKSMGDCLFFLVERNFFENSWWGLDTLLAPLNRAGPQWFTGSSVNCEFCDIRKRTEKNG